MELVQEAHLRLLEYQRSAKVKNADSLLRRIVINLSINYFHRTLSAPFSFESVDALDRQGMLIDPAASQERGLAAEQDLQKVVDVLGGASQRMCRIFVAQRMGYSHEEIAAVYGIMPRTVEKYVVSASGVLKEMMPAAFSNPVASKP